MGPEIAFWAWIIASALVQARMVYLNGREASNGKA
jgi:hypothetical protein